MTLEIMLLIERGLAKSGVWKILPHTYWWRCFGAVELGI